MQALLPAGQSVVSRGSGGDEGTGHRVNMGQKVKCFPTKMGYEIPNTPSNQECGVH